MKKSENQKSNDDMTSLADKLFSAIPGIEDAKSVETIHVKNLSEEEFKERFINSSTPCLIKGAINHWPAAVKWKNKEYWISVCENKPVTIFNVMNFFDLNKRKEKSVNLPFHEAIERLFTGRDEIFSIPSQYIGNDTLYSLAKEDIKGFSFLPSPDKPLWDNEMALFIYRRAATTWHVHYCDETLMCQVNGSKRVALIPPNIPKPGYVTDFLERELFQHGQVMEGNLNLLPRIVEVQEGDSLYIPPHWFHCVVPVDGEIGFTVAFNFKSPVHKNGDLRSYFVRRLYKKAWSVPSVKIKVTIPIYMTYAILKNIFR